MNLIAIMGFIITVFALWQFLPKTEFEAKFLIVPTNHKLEFNSVKVVVSIKNIGFLPVYGMMNFTKAEELYLNAPEAALVFRPSQNTTEKIALRRNSSRDYEIGIFYYNASLKDLPPTHSNRRYNITNSVHGSVSSLKDPIKASFRSGFYNRIFVLSLNLFGKTIKFHEYYDLALPAVSKILEAGLNPHLFLKKENTILNNIKESRELLFLINESDSQKELRLEKINFLKKESKARADFIKNNINNFKNANEAYLFFEPILKIKFKDENTNSIVFVLNEELPSFSEKPYLAEKSIVVMFQDNKVYSLK